MIDKDNQLVRFDWAIKRLLRDKANFGILEGFLTSLLDRPIKIERILESEGNKDYAENKSNRVDILAMEADGSHILIEVQNETQDAYFHRILFGTSKVINDYLKEGDNYDKISKIYSINIVYFRIDEGEDFVYKGVTEFHGLHNGEPLILPDYMKAKYKVESVSGIFPEYFILKANDFNKVAKTPLEQWMHFLSKSRLPENADAPGLQEAGEKLRFLALPEEERKAYFRYIDGQLSIDNSIESALYRGHYEGRKEGIEEVAKNMMEMGLDFKTISDATKIPLDELLNLKN